ncbi:hypothetical protein TWF703_008294 [Orbilia oligospora]|uniref:F-box domain-containing protein n=1 Tax=Orbilia oligospora TaxID=2813651 RepID=A0A7C8JX25_ORBOL|nr:hypothetical protein TWF703_008294 [Orbilia oligospora]
MASSSSRTVELTNSQDAPSQRLFLLDMPVEVVERVFKCLDREGLKNVACCSSATRNIAYPILHRSLLLKFHHEEPITKNSCGLTPKFVEYILTVLSRETMSYYRHIKTTSTFETHRRIRPGIDNVYYRTITTRKLMTAMDDIMLRMILARLQRDQLLTIKFGNSTSVRTLIFILSGQGRLKELSLGDLGSYTDLSEDYCIPAIIFKPTENRLTVLEMGNILQGAASTVLKIIHQGSATLKKLRFGNTNHQGMPRFPEWKATTHDFFSGKLDNLSFRVIQLAALVQLHIVHDRQFSSFAGVLADMITGCVRLTRVRLSGCTGFSKLVRLLETAGARIESLQICECNRIDADPDGSKPDDWSDDEEARSCVPRGYTLPYMGTIHTLQLTGYSHPDNELPEMYSFVNKKQIQRLWVGCQLPERDPLKCPSTWGLLRNTKLTETVIFASTNWQLLRELAIPHPGPLISELLFLKSLRVLRLLKWKPRPPEARRYSTHQRRDVEITREVNGLLAHFADGPATTPPSVRLLIVDKHYGHNYCSRVVNPNPCYLAVGAYVERFYEGTDEVDLYRPLVKPIDLNTTLKLCLQNGCSTYLLASGPPSPERFWEDTYGLVKDPS